MNPSDKLDRLAAEVAREVKRYSLDDARRGRRIAEFGYRVASLLIQDDATLEQIASGSVPETPPNEMARGRTMSDGEERARR